MKKLILALIILLNVANSFGQVCDMNTTPSKKIKEKGLNNVTISNLNITVNDGNAIELFNSSNIIIENCYFNSPKGEGISLYDCENVIIRNCYFDTNRTGVYATEGSSIKVMNNEFKDPQGPFPRGQYVQFNRVNGAGNRISFNRGESSVGHSNPEDLISAYNSSGTVGDPFLIEGNWFRGSGDSKSGGGIMLGDGGGSNIIARDNILVDPGQYGIAVSGGHNNKIYNNIVYGKQQYFTNVGIYVAKYYSGTCGEIEVRGNQVNWTNKSGTPNHLWNSNDCGSVIGWSDNILGAAIDESILPDQLLCADNQNSVPAVVADAGADQSICLGNKVTLTANGGDQYEWSTGETTSSIDVSPGSTTTYTVTVSDGTSSDTDNVVVTVNSVQAEAGADVTVEEGEEVKLTASGGDSYEWSTGEVSQSITVSPNTTTTYSVIVKQGTCQDEDSVKVTVNQSSPPAVVADAGADQSICLGNKVTLTANGGDQYEWSTGETTSSIDVSPGSTTTYTVTVSDGTSSDTDNVVVTVNSVQAEAGADVTVEEGEEVKLTASGGDSYEWSTGEVSQSITVSPNTTTTYSVIVKQGACQNEDSVKVTVNQSSPPAVVADAGADQSICLGDKVTLTANGGDQYEWSTGETTSSIDVSPGSTTTYTVTVSDGTSSDTDNVVVTVNSVQAEAGADVTVEEGEEVKLTASGGDSYEWSTGEVSQSITVSPNTTTTYSVIVKQGACQNEDSVKVTVNQSSPPAVVADAGADQSICLGDKVTLTANGGDQYEWSTGETTSSIDVSPESTTTYTVTVSDGTSSDTDNVVVTVNSVQAEAGADVTVEEGEEIKLTASGGDSYQWSTGEVSQSITVSPNTTTTYSVIVKQGACQNEDSVKVTVNQSSPPAVVADAGADQSICLGDKVTLTANGGDQYEWSTGETTSSIDVSPGSTTTYTVTVSDGTSSDTDNVVVTVNSVQAEAGADVTVEEGEEVKLTASGGDSYEWSTGEVSQSITVSPNTTTTYSVIVKQGACQNEDSVKVTVNQSSPPAVVADAGADQSICLGDKVTLTANGGDQYEWSTGETTSSIDVSPESTTTYTVTVSDGTSSDTDNVVVTVNSVQAEAGADVTINQGEKITLKASGGDSYQWSTGEKTQSITVSPKSLNIYSVRVIKGACEDEDSVKVAIKPNINIVPPVVADAGADQSICLGNKVTLTATGGDQYEWSTGETTSSIDVSPGSTTTYTVTVSDGTSSDTDNVVVTVNSAQAEAGADVTVEEGKEVKLTASDGDSYQWSTGEVSQSITVSPNTTTTYSVIVKQGACQNEDSVKVTVNQNSAPPVVTAFAGEDVTICQGEEILLQGSGGELYYWSTGQYTKDITVSPKRTTVYELRVVANGVENVDSLIVYVENCDNDSATDQLSESQVSIYPNPTTGEFKIFIDDSYNDSYRYDILSLTGIFLLTGEANMNNQSNTESIVNLNEFAKGIYLVRVYNNYQSITKKLIVN